MNLVFIQELNLCRRVKNEHLAAGRQYLQGVRPVKPFDTYRENGCWIEILGALRQESQSNKTLSQAVRVIPN